MIDARLFDLEDDPPEDSAALMGYASATSGQLASMASLICGETGFAADAAAAGTFWGVAGLLRALPHHAGQRRVYLPNDYLREYGLTADDVVERRNPAAMGAAVAAIVAFIGRSKAAGINVPRPARPVRRVFAGGDVVFKKSREGGVRCLRGGARAVAVPWTD